MTAPATIEGRIYMTENSLFEACEELSAMTERLDERLAELASAVHRTRTDRSAMALEDRALRIGEALLDFLAETKLGALTARAHVVGSLKGRVDELQAELRAATVQPEATTEALSIPRELVGAGR